MSAYTKKRILLILTGGTIAGNVASNKVVEGVKKDANDFLEALQTSTEILKKNWAIGIEAQVAHMT